MRVSQESFTVLPDATLREVSVLVAGMRISLTTEETRRLVSALAKGLQSLGISEARLPTDNGVEGEPRDFAAELRSVKDEMKHPTALPRTA